MWLKSIRSVWYYSHRSAVYVIQVGMHFMVKVHIDLQYMWLQTDPQCMSLTPIRSVPYVQVSRQSVEYVQPEASSQCTYLNDQKS